MPVKTPPPTDLTGTKAAALRKQAEEDATDRANEISMATASRNEQISNTILDVTHSPDAPVVVDEITVLEDDPESDKVLIRVADDIEEATIGDRTYDFVAGQQYLVSKNVEFVLREAGRLYLRG